MEERHRAESGSWSGRYRSPDKRRMRKQRTAHVVADGKKQRRTALTAADPLCRDLMSNGRPWQKLSVGPSAAWAGLACCSRLAGEGSLCCRWPIVLRLHNARNALVSRRRRGE